MSRVDPYRVSEDRSTLISLRAGLPNVPVGDTPVDPDPPDPDPPGSQHEALLADPYRLGYGRNTTGAGAAGATPPTIWVTNTNNSGSGSLRAACQASGARWVRFDPNVFPTGGNATIHLTSMIFINNPNITIDGRGAHVTVRNYGLRVDASNVIVNNIHFRMDTHFGGGEGTCPIMAGYYVSPRPNRHWYHRNTFTGPGQQSSNADGALDIAGVDDITITYNHFTGWQKCHLLATGCPVQEAADRVTATRNFFDRNGGRMPLARHGTFHYYNNYYYNSRWTSNYNECIVASDATTMLVERNIFVNELMANPNGVQVMNECGYGNGRTRLVGNYTAQPHIMDQNNPGAVGNPPYNYSAALVDTQAQRNSLIGDIIERGGWAGGP